ncbi:uncharacterized protein LOC135943585 [Cloeon dipterum]|uniref:uncharacterized protein LOC135943585 n=1 Tax=Cloeon dipterum TaxID=197152 RepID=UPI00321FA28D
MHFHAVAIILAALLAPVIAKPFEHDDVEEMTVKIYGNDCEVNGKVYPKEEHFHPQDNPCKYCICVNGAIECDTIQCDWLSDCTPVYEEKSCCPKFVNCSTAIAESFEEPLPQNERLIVTDEEEEINPPVVQVEHLDLISTLSVNPGAGTTVVEEFTKDSAVVTESSVEAPIEATPEELELSMDEPEAMESRTDEVLTATDRVPIKLREGDFENFATTISPSDFFESREAGDEILQEVKQDDSDERFEISTVGPDFEAEGRDESPNERLQDATVPPSDRELDEINATEDVATDAPSMEMREAAEDASWSVTEFADYTKAPFAENEIQAELRNTDDIELVTSFTSTTTENAFTTTTGNFESIVSTTTAAHDDSLDVTTKFTPVPDVIVGKIVDDTEAKVTELNAEVLVEETPSAQKTSEAVVVTTTSDPDLVETVSLAHSESSGAASAEIQIEEKKKNSSAELKIFQVLYSTDEDKQLETSRSADAAMFFLPQLPRPLASPPASALSPSDWKANAFEETKEEIMAGLWHEALDILTGGRSAARSQARKAHNSKFHRN